MYLYFWLFMIILMLRIICKKNKKIFCILTGFFLWLILAVRSEKIGLSDTVLIYKPFFEMIKQMNFIDILNYKWMTDKGFSIISKFLSLFITNYQLFIAICAIPYVYFVMKFIEERSPKPLTSIIIYISLYYMYATFLLRQVIAIGILMLAIKQIENRNLKKFIFCVIFASLIHKTALIFLVAYPFSIYNKFGVKNYIYIVGAYIVAVFFKLTIINFVSIFDFTGKIALSLKYGIYSVSGDISMFGLFIDVIIIVFTNFYYDKIIKNEKNIEIYMNLGTLGAIFFALSKVVTEFYRVSFYFSIINILLIPFALNEEKNKKTELLIELLIITIFVVYFFTRTINNVNANPYLFFWE